MSGQHRNPNLAFGALLTALLVAAVLVPSAWSGVKSFRKISDTAGGFTGRIQDNERLGQSNVLLGDLDGDGIGDLAVGAYFDSSVEFRNGAVWILFLNADGTVRTQRKITEGMGGFTDDLNYWNEFGVSLASLGDVDGDAVPDLAVGARLDDGNGGYRQGAVWILFLKTNGTVKRHQKITSLTGGFSVQLDDDDWFGASIANMGDMDGNGVVDIAVGAYLDDDGGVRQGANRGAVYLLYLNADGTVKAHTKISSTQGGFAGKLDDHDHFGISLNSLGDLDGDGVTDMAVAAHRDDDSGEDRGAVYVLFLDKGGAVKNHQKVSGSEGGFTGGLDNLDRFGAWMSLVGDLDCDGHPDLAVGAQGDDDGGSDAGAVWILSLAKDGTVMSHQKISATSGGFEGDLDRGDEFGVVSSLGDFDGDGHADIVVGARLDDDGGYDRGAVWILLLDCEDVPTTVHLDIKPGSCPNPLNIHPCTKERKNGKKPEGVLPVAILGGPNFDVRDVDLSSLRLEGVAPLRHSYEDVTRPASGNEECDCTTRGPDGIMDLALKFSRQEIVATFGPVEDGDELALTVAGFLVDGTPFEASDCVTIVSRRSRPPFHSGPDRVVIHPVVPNPFNPVTRIRYALPEKGFVKLSVYDVSGRLVERLVSEEQPAGEYVIEWNAKRFSSGVYFCRFEVDDFAETRKLIFLK